MKKSNEIQEIFGYHAVKAALKNISRTHIELSIIPKYREFAEKFDKIVPKINILSPNDFYKKYGNERVTQGIYLISKSLPYISLENFIEKEKINKNSVIIVLDRITDPQNIGSIMRSSLLFKCNAIVVSKNNSPDITSSLIKAASGALEKVRYIRVTNLQRALKFLKNNKYWIFGLDSGNKITKLENVISNKCVYILGAEGDGIRNLIKKECDELLTLPFTRDKELEVDSLNVSNAASIALYEYYKKYFD